MIERASTGISATVVIAAISVLHVYWARGGERFAANAIPTRSGKPTINPGPVTTYTVAGLLATAGLAGALSTARLGGRTPRILAAGAGLVFLLRAMGDFRLVGFFKKERATEFAKLDTRIYSPLCLLVGFALLRSAR